MAPPGGTGMSYAANVAGSNCIGPSAPAALAPEWTPGRFDVPYPDSTVPMAANTAHDRPGQVPAACSYRVSMAGGIAPAAAVLGLEPPESRVTMPATPASTTAPLVRTPAATPTRARRGAATPEKRRSAGTRCAHSSYLGPDRPAKGPRDAQHYAGLPGLDHRHPPLRTGGARGQPGHHGRGRGPPLSHLQ